MQSTFVSLTRGKTPSLPVQIRRTTTDLTRFRRGVTVSALTQTAVKVKQVGKFSVKGTSRKQNEDRLNVLVRTSSVVNQLCCCTTPNLAATEYSGSKHHGSLFVANF